LLEDSDVSPFKVARQVQFRWPGPHAVGPGVEQYVEAVGRPTVLVFLFGFDNDEAAKAGADFWAHSMAEIFTEGGLDDVAVGESCWVSVSGSGAALVFQRGPFCVSVGVITDIASERSIITEIAQKLDGKIVGYLGSAQVNDAPGSDQPEESPSGAEYSVGPYTLTRTPAPEVLVRGVDVKGVAARHVPAFEPYREHTIGAWGTCLELRELPSDSMVMVEIQMAVYDSVLEAENQVLSFLCSISALYQKADDAKLRIGDSGNCWVSDRQAGSSVTFVRKNVLVVVSVYAANAPEEVRRIARAIDEDILTGTKAVELGQKVPGSTENYLANVKRLTKLYDFANWPGKDGGIRDGFKVDPSILPEGLVFKRIPVPGAGIDRATGLLSAGRSYVLTRGDGGGQLRIHVSVAETCDQAQGRLIQSLVNTQMRQPPLTPRGAEYGLDIGDICFARRGQDGNFQSVTWVRNNIFVRMWSGVDDMRPFVEPLARALDAGILKRPTFKTYVECASRPVITRVARVTLAGLEAGLAVKWQAVEVHDPQGEEVVLKDSRSVLRSRDSVGSVREWGGITFHIAVNESNLVGFPLPGAAEWKQNGPEPEEVNARINAFLKKFEQPSQSAEAPAGSQADLHWFFRGLFGLGNWLARLWRSIV